MVRDSEVDIRVQALANLKIGGDSDEILGKVASLLRDESDFVRQRSISRLDEVDDLNPSFFAGVVPLLVDKGSLVAWSAFNFFDHRGNERGDLGLQAALLNTASAIPAKERPGFRAHLRLWAGGNAAMQRSVTWLGCPDFDPMPKEGLSPKDRSIVLAALGELWDHSAGKEALREEISGRIAQIVKAISENPDSETTSILNELRRKLEGESAAAKTVEAIRDAVAR